MPLVPLSLVELFYRYMRGGRWRATVLCFIANLMPVLREVGDVLRADAVMG